MILSFAIRNIKKHFSLNLIKFTGLASALCGILFIVLFINNELSYDTVHKNAERIYRFTSKRNLPDKEFARVYRAGMVPAMADNFPEIENFVRLAPVRGETIEFENNYYSTREAFLCDSTFFRVFDADMQTGNVTTALQKPGTAVLSVSFAQKLFGNRNPMGQIFSIPSGQFNTEALRFTVTGVMKDFPQNGHLHPDFLASAPRANLSGWAYVYLLLRENADPASIAHAYPQFVADRSNVPLRELNVQASLQKLTDIHLHSHKLREIEPNGNPENIYVLALAALLLLLIALSNYTSLNLGMSGFYDKFLSVNKLLGSGNFLKLKYYLTENLLILTSTVFTACLLCIPINRIIFEHYNLDLLAGNTLLLFAVPSIFVLLCLLSLFPMFLNRRSEQISESLKRSKYTMGKTMEVTQFTIAMVLIITFFVIVKQTRYILNNSLGAENEYIICMESMHTDVQKKFDIFKAELSKYNSIESVSAMLEPPGGEANDMFRFKLEGYRPTADNEYDYVGVFPCDYSFAKVFSLQFLSGANFTDSFRDNDGFGEYIINAAALEQFGYHDPSEIIGKPFRLIAHSENISLPKGHITGVVENFHLSNMKREVRPLVMFKRKNTWLINFVVSLKPGQEVQALNDIKNTWKSLFPAYPFKFDYVDSMYSRVYRTEILQSRLLFIFTGIALFICMMGMLGLALLNARKRTKEIGIRKVNGAKTAEVLYLLNNSLLKSVAPAFALAVPLSYITAKHWLTSFAYKTGLDWWIFITAGLLTTSIALLTVSRQSMKAATRNPVEALRYE